MINSIVDVGEEPQSQNIPNYDTKRKSKQTMTYSTQATDQTKETNQLPLPQQGDQIATQNPLDTTTKPTNR